jgi:hypothetical protein
MCSQSKPVLGAGMRVENRYCSVLVLNYHMEAVLIVSSKPESPENIHNPSLFYFVLNVYLDLYYFFLIITTTALEHLSGVGRFLGSLYSMWLSLDWFKGYRSTWTSDS